MVLSEKEKKQFHEELVDMLNNMSDMDMKNVVMIANLLNSGDIKETAKQYEEMIQKGDVIE